MRIMGTTPTGMEAMAMATDRSRTIATNRSTHP